MEGKMVRKEFDWKLQLQLFADTEPSDPEDNPEENPDGNKKNPEPPKGPEPKYTDEDLDKIINKKFAEWEKKKQKDIDEAKRLENLTAEEKKEKELADMKKELADFKSQANRAKMADAARAILSEKGVNASDLIVNLLIADDAETTKKTVEAYIDAFQSEVNKAVKNALKGTEPPKGGSPTGLTKADIMKEPNREKRQRLIQENIKLFT